MRRTRGFTLVELLVVIGIISLLAGSMYLAVRSSVFESREKATKGILGALRIGLEAYRGQFRAYPPDGIDFVVLDYRNRPIKNTACLLHFLTQPIVKVSRVGTETFVNRVGPFMRPLKDEYLTGDLDADDGNLVEIIDAWGNPYNYDNTGDKFSNEFQADPMGVHTMVDLEPYNVDLDPRDGKPQGADPFDLWSCGPTCQEDITGDDVPADYDERAEDDITSWGRM